MTSVKLLDRADAIEIWAIDKYGEPIIAKEDFANTKYYSVQVHVPGEGLHDLADFGETQYDIALAYAQYWGKRKSLEVSDYGKR
jgi:hypothetical protein